MRIVISSSPFLGHLLPMLPVAAAAVRAGHIVEVLAHRELAPYAAGLPVHQAGLSASELLALSRQAAPGDAGFTPRRVANVFATLRVGTGGDDAIDRARKIRPDLVIAESADQYGPLIAADLGVPLVEHAFTLALPQAYVDEVQSAMADEYALRGLHPPSRIALIDPWPRSLQAPGWTAPGDRLALRAVPHGDGLAPLAVGQNAQACPEQSHATPDRPRVLFTLGTNNEHDGDIDSLLAAVLSVDDVQVVATEVPGRPYSRTDGTRDRLRICRFTPLSALLPHVDAVVARPGAGTALAVAAAAKPLVAVPAMADQHLVAERLSAAGAAVVATRTTEVAPALRAVLGSTHHRTAASRLAKELSRAMSADEVLAALLPLGGSSCADG